MVLVAVACFALPTLAQAHGVEHRIERGDAVQVWFSAHGGAVLADAGYRIYPPSPNGERKDAAPYARGKTDALGRVVFVPDQNGDWRLVLATEDGHGADVAIPVATEYSGDAAPTSHVEIAKPGRLLSTLSGVGYVFGLAGIWMMWRSRRN